jgi:hypothetical protein
LTLLYATGLASPVGPNPALVPMLVRFIGSLWSFFIHANVRWRLGPLEEIIASPAFHHWHHTLEDHKDHNYSAMLPFIDRLFGTFYLPKAWPKDYGNLDPGAGDHDRAIAGAARAERRGPRPIAGPVLEPGLIARNWSRSPGLKSRARVRG